MQYSASDFRTMAREALRGKWGVAILMTIVAGLLGVATLAGISVEFKFESGTGLIMELPWETYTLMYVGTLNVIFAMLTLVWTIFTLVIGGALTLGYYQFHQNLARKQDADLGTLFVHKDLLWHGFCINFLQGLYIILWTLCLIIPGIVAGYSYAMAHYIANDHPEMTANEVITASKEMMRGHRWRLFCLDISFIGWELLAALTLGIGSYAVAPYRETARAFFYQDLCDNGMRLEGSILG